MHEYLAVRQRSIYSNHIIRKRHPSKGGPINSIPSLIEKITHVNARAGAWLDGTNHEQEIKRLVFYML